MSGNPHDLSDTKTRTHLNTIFGYVQELVPGRIGTSGFFFGFAFGLGGIGSALHQRCLPRLRVPLVGGHPERLSAKSEPAQNRCDALITRSLSIALVCAIRLPSASKI